MNKRIAFVLITATMQVKAQNTNEKILPLTPITYKLTTKIHCGCYDFNNIIDCIKTPDLTNLLSTITQIDLLNYKHPTSFTLNKIMTPQIPAINLPDIVSISAYVYQRQRGGEVMISGGRPSETLYVVDGMQIMR